jgi:oligopeptide transport system substrate-binding protein
MSLKKMSVVLGVLLIASMVLTACPAPQPQVVEKIVTQVVEQKVEVVQTQIVEKTVEKTVEKVVVATAEPVVAPKKLRINLDSYPDVIDPQKSSFVNEIAHLKLMYEGLTKLDKDLKTVPGAAEKWEYNADATELTFTLRPDLKYSDGSLLNAARFAYAIKRNINPETAGEYAQITDEIKGAPEWRGCGDDAAKCEEAMKVLDASIMSLHADGQPCDAEKPYEDAACNTLKLTFSKPAPTSTPSCRCG